MNGRYHRRSGAIFGYNGDEPATAFVEVRGRGSDHLPFDENERG